MAKRVIVFVLDSLGIGAMPDADRFGDEGSHTLKSCFLSGYLSVPNLCRLGLGNIEGASFLPREEKPLASFGRMAEKSRGKDTTVGHWELAGLVSEHPLPTYPNGFDSDLMEEFSRRCGRGYLCNLPYSGTEVIEKYGREHMETGKLIVYTSADSVFQIAAHEKIVPLSELYRICEIAREMLVGIHGVGRVIARPFVSGENGFVRTANRHDYSLLPPGKTLPDVISENGLAMIGVGKISDIFAGRGITESYRSESNRDGMEKALRLIREKDFQGMLFVNLVDFDAKFGHRNDAAGYAKALTEFDRFLPKILDGMKSEDVLILTADHGCDPGTVSTDHSREYVPLLVYGESVSPVDLGTREGFSDVAVSVCDFLGLKAPFSGVSFAK